MRILGLSYPQLRKRLDSLARVDGLLDGQVRKGHNGKLEYDPAVLEMLREIDLLVSKPGTDMEQAAQELRAKLRGNGSERVATAASNWVNLESNPLAVEIHYLKRMVEDLRRERDSWKELTLSLQSQLALPSPKRRWWWPFRVRSLAE